MDVLDHNQEAIILSIAIRYSLDEMVKNKSTTYKSKSSIWYVVNQMIEDGWVQKTTLNELWLTEKAISYLVALGYWDPEKRDAYKRYTRSFVRFQ